VTVICWQLVLGSDQPSPEQLGDWQVPSATMSVNRNKQRHAKGQSLSIVIISLSHGHKTEIQISATASHGLNEYDQVHSTGPMTFRVDYRQPLVLLVCTLLNAKMGVGITRPSNKLRGT
jgi:hypothetical protein